ncbi:MAG: hypothetical protein AB1449_10610 [Chloroflexota bacterium]
MARVLFLFLDGVGLGEDDPSRNPLAAAATPHLQRLLGGQRLLLSTTPFESEFATLLAIDACLGVPGRPQSASGQATLVTGRNVPAEIGRHYGPKPNPEIAAILQEDNLFQQVARAGGSSALLNAYPPRYFEAIDSRRRLYSAIPLAASLAGIPLRTAADLQAGRALSADLTGAGWAAQPTFPPAPVYTPVEAGRLLAHLSVEHDLTWFDYWPSDYAGHRGSLPESIHLVETLDGVLGGLVEAWRDRQDLVVVTSDHGNLEDLTARGHTTSPVPALLIGPPDVRRSLAAQLHDLRDFAPAILQAIFGKRAPAASR